MFSNSKLQRVAKLNPIKLKISLEFNIILNITKNSKITKTEGKKIRMGEFFSGGIYSSGELFRGDFFLEPGII